MKKTFMCLFAALLILMGMAALAEDPAMPVVSLEGDCLADYANWNDNSTYQPATLIFQDGERTFTMDIEIKPQGTSSLFAPKKNFTVKLSEGVEMADGWGVQEKYVLKADYIDPTRSGNVVSAKLAAEMNKQYDVMTNTPNHGVIDGFPVWVKINGEDAGIFSWTIPKDAWLFAMDEENPNHLVLSCEGWTPAGRLQTAQIDYETDWTFEVGEATEESKAAFERMVTFVSTANDAAFVKDFDQYLDLDACLNYLCFVNIAYGSDNVAKNMLMVTYDGKIWAPALYDLDSLWGVGYDGTARADTPWQTELLTNGNCLLYRVNHLFGAQVRQRYWELREGVLSKERIMAAFEAYAAQIPQEYYDIDRALWNADGAHIRTLELMSQLMDEYLPIVDAHFQEPVETSAADALNGPEIHYVWEVNGVQQSTGDIAALPVSMTLTYALDGQEIALHDLMGKSGRLETTLRVERKALADHAYGVAALIHPAQAQCGSITVNGGEHTDADHACVVKGTAWLGGTHNVYELKLTMDVTDYQPAEYVVVASPIHVDGGADSLQPLLATAGELTAIINEGILLHETTTELQGYLVNMEGSLTKADEAAKKLLPAEGAQESAASVMQELLSATEAEADAWLTGLGYEVAAEATTADRVQLLMAAEADELRTEEEKAQAAAQRGLMEKYLLVVTELDATKRTVGEINDELAKVMPNLPELIDAYGYANDQLYGVLYKLSELYQDLANYYYANSGDGDGYDYAEMGDWYDVVIFTNHEVVTKP